MADFDNGLPPDGTDVTGNSVNGANISSSDAEQADKREVAGLFIRNEFTGSNWGTML
ncbi:MAG: hypothetical protein LBQ74_03960 [Prevotella sp.]|jgi:hypothetical protein|nr:hypothetical protein [Prevotella sp.]